MPPSSRTVLAVVVVAVALAGVALPVATAADRAATTADAPAEATAQGEFREPVVADDVGLPARLTLGPDATGEVHTLDADASAALDGSGTQLQGRFDELTLQNRIDDAEDDAAARSEIRDGLSHLDREISRLADREREAVRAYRNGELTTEEFLLELRAVHDRARANQRLLALLDDRSESVPGISVENDLNRLRGENFLRQGPLREELSAAAAYERDPARVSVRANENGVVLAGIEGGQFRREATRTDNFEFEIVEPNPDLSSERAKELYPSLGGFRAITVSADQTSDEMWTPHAYGELTVHFDIRTEQVFREEQQLDLQAIEDASVGDEELPPTREATSVSVNEHRLVVNRTYPGGPAQVTVERVTRADNGTIVDAEPVDVTVMVQGDAAGTTGPDGELWVVLPQQDEVRVEAAVGDGVLVGTVTWS